MTKTGIFGGSFDPIHYGHLILAERCRDLVNLDRVIFVPTYQSPHKQERPQISDTDRLELLKLALSGNRSFECSTIEMDQQQIGYTVDTLTAFAKQLPEDELYFLLGSDSLASFARWKSPDRICELAQILRIDRPGLPPPDFDQLEETLSRQSIDNIRRHEVRSPLIEISSSEIRRRLDAGESVRYFLPDACRHLIEHKKLYQSKEL